MENIDFTIDNEDLKCLFIACSYNKGFESFVKECKVGYTSYYERNLGNIERWGKPKTFPQWVNGQTITLT
jgi:hypothetical protein